MLSSQPPPSGDERETLLTGILFKFCPQRKRLQKTL